MKAEELIEGLWIICRHANDLNNDYRSVLDRRYNIKTIKEVIKKLKNKK